MEPYAGIIYLIASIGVINGLFVLTYLLIKGPRTLQDYLFLGLLFALITRIGKSVYYYFSESPDLLILQVGLSIGLFIGIFFYLFIRTNFLAEKKLKRIDKFSLMILLSGILLIGLIWPYRTNPEIWNEYIVKSIYFVWLFYVVLGLYHARTFISQSVPRFWSLQKSQKFLLGLIVGTVFITFTYQFALFVHYITYIWGAIGFTIFFYSILLLNLIPNSRVSKNKSILPSDQESLITQLDQVMNQDKLYKNPKLKLNELAERINLNKHQLSQLLNDAYPNGFAQYVNSWRVEEAKKLITIKEELSMEGIGYESGFNSKSSFYTTFKKFTAQTPAQFKNSSRSAVK